MECSKSAAWGKAIDFIGDKRKNRRDFREVDEFIAQLTLENSAHSMPGTRAVVYEPQVEKLFEMKKTLSAKEWRAFVAKRATTSASFNLKGWVRSSVMIGCRGVSDCQFSW